MLNCNEGEEKIVICGNKFPLFIFHCLFFWKEMRKICDELRGSGGGLNRGVAKKGGLGWILNHLDLF